MPDTPRTTLVATADLAARLGDPQWIVFDCRHDLAQPGLGRAQYAAAHLPGARFLHLDEDLSGPMNGRNGRHPLPDPHVLAGKLGAAGVDRDKQVVAYDDAGGMTAVRLWWLLRWLGHDAVAVLDGGLAAWLQEGRPTTSDVPRPVRARCPVELRSSTVSADDVLAHLHDPHAPLVDARAPGRYRGENETLDPVAGHIPGALNRFFRDNLDAGGRFKPAAQLRAEWRALIGDVPAAQLVHSCGSGVSACHNLLALEVAGLAGGRLYPGSWSEWCAEPSRPVATGPDPG